MSLEIKVINPPEELKSYPLTQSLVLESSEQLEDSLLKSNIALLREVQEYGLLNTANLYNYNIGYVKETFLTVPVKIVQYTTESGSYRIRCTPEEPLSPSSTYMLFLDKAIKREHISIVKRKSLGPSELKIKDSGDTTLDFTSNKYVLKVMSEPYMTATSNIVKLKLYINDEPGKTFTVDTKSDKRTVKFSNIILELKDTVFGLNEQFEIVSNGVDFGLKEHFLLHIETVLSDKIKPLENIQPSQVLSNEDVIAYYEKELNNKEKIIEGIIDYTKNTWMSEQINIEYAGYNKVILHLKDLNAAQLDLNALTFREQPAYNKYDLTSLDLYDETSEVNLEYEILDEKTIMFIFNIKEI